MLVEDLQTCNVELISWARLSASFRHIREHKCGMEVLAAFLEKHMMGNFSDLPMSNLTVNTCKISKDESGTDCLLFCLSNSI